MDRKNQPYVVGNRHYCSAQSRAAGVAAMRAKGEVPAVEYCDSQEEALAKAGLI